MTLDESVVCAVKYCIENDILKDFLRIHGSEVVALMVHEYTTEDFVKAIVEHAREEEREQVARKMKTSGEPLNKIIDFTGLSTETIQNL